MSNSLDNAMIPLMPIWDTINDLKRLRGLVHLTSCLIAPVGLQEDHDFEVFHDLFSDLYERLDGACAALDAARGKVVFIRQKEGGH